MNITDLIGSIGVFLLLIAYFMNLAGKISKDGMIYIIMNVLGASLAMTASIFLHYLPFIVLEGIWTMVSLIALIRIFIVHPKLS